RRSNRYAARRGRWATPSGRTAGSGDFATGVAQRAWRRRTSSARRRAPERRSGESSRALDLHRVAVRIFDIDRRVRAARAVALDGVPRIHAVSEQVLSNRGLVERVQEQAEVVEIASLAARRAPAAAPDFAVDRHDVDQAVPGA